MQVPGFIHLKLAPVAVTSGKDIGRDRVVEDDGRRCIEVVIGLALVGGCGVAGGEEKRVDVALRAVSARHLDIVTTRRRQIDQCCGVAARGQGREPTRDGILVCIPDAHAHGHGLGHLGRLEQEFAMMGRIDLEPV